MKYMTPEKILLNKFGCLDRYQLFEKQEITYTQLDIILSAMEDYTKQKLNIHGVSGKRPLMKLYLDQKDDGNWIVVNRETGERKEFGLFTDCKHDALEYIYHNQAACASGAVDKTVCEGNALQNFLKQEKEIEKQDGKIFDE